MTKFFKILARRMPGLQLKLKQANMQDSPERFVRRSLLGSFYLTFALLLVVAGFFSKSPKLIWLLVAVGPLIFAVGFFYMLRVPDAKAHKIKSDVNCEVVDAGRFLIVELESGVPLYNSLSGVHRNFPRIGRYFRKIVVNIDSGTAMEDAITEALEITPSKELRRVLWQVLNSLKTGSDVAGGMKEVVEQISREHLIEMRSYGRKLNPMSMFYMMIAVIVPSLGVAMLVIMSSLFSLQIDMFALIVLALILGFIQFMFLAVIRSSRPAINT